MIRRDLRAVAAVFAVVAACLPACSRAAHADRPEPGPDPSTRPAREKSAGAHADPGPTPAPGGETPAPGGENPARPAAGFDDDPLMRLPSGSQPDRETEAAETAPADEKRFFLSGYVKNETAFRTSRPNEFSKILNVFQLETTWKPTELLSFTAIGRAHYDAVFDVENGFSQEAEDDYETEADLREAYVDVRPSGFHMRAGRQQIVWGDTIGLKVLDIINPQDFREFILDDFIDSRIPLWSLRTEWFAGDVGPFSELTLEGIWIPHLRFPEPPVSGSEYAPRAPEIPAGLAVVVERPNQPSESLEHAEWGFRARSVVDEWDLSLSYFNGWDDVPVASRRFDPATFTLTLEPEHRRAQVVGASATNAFGEVVVSAEVAWWVRRAFASEDPGDHEGVVRKEFVNFGIGADGKAWGVDVGVQYFQSVIFDYESDLVANRTQSAASLFVRETFWNDTLTASAFLLHDLETDDEWARLEVGYDVTDHLNVKLGTDLLEGKQRGAIGAFDHTDRVYMEVKLSF